MKIKIQQFLFGKSHSWAIVGQNIGRALIKLGHDVDFVSTDGFEDRFCPPDLVDFVKLKDLTKEKLIEQSYFLGKYDCQISYTAPHNWGTYLANGNKNRFGIWNYEYNKKADSNVSILPGFAKFCDDTDLVLPSSNFSKDVFLSMKAPSEKLRVVPHGINIDDFNSDSKYQLKTKASKKILLNVAQPHKRKALHLALESFGKAFNKNDDVCLVAKVFKQNNSGSQFDVNFDDILRNFNKKFPNHAELELVYEFIPNISDIYRSCDINFSATFAECWHLPSLEAMAAGLINVVPNYGGQLDFCNEQNSLLINGKIVRAPRDHQYWKYNPYAVHFEISTDDAALKLQTAVSDYDSLIRKFKSSTKDTANRFTWENVAKEIVGLCE